MKTFKTKQYDIHTSKLNHSCKVKAAVIADLHGVIYGKNNQLLIDEVNHYSPDIILIPGDMIIRYNHVSEQNALSLLSRLCESYPVYYSAGNHERSAFLAKSDYFSVIENMGVVYLQNKTKHIEVGNQRLAISGLDLPLEYFKKPNPPSLDCVAMDAMISNEVSNDVYHILLAHTPRYIPQYYEWGADLIVSGHYHGGIIRFDENHGLLSPQIEIFPKFCCGMFHHNQQNAIVSAGLGAHTITLRVHNAPELICLNICGT